MCFNKLIFGFKALFAKWMSASVKQFYTFSVKYLGHGLIFVSLLAGFQYLGWKLTFQCSSSIWAVCFFCLLKNSDVLCKNAMSSLWPFLPLQALTIIFTLILPVFLFFLSAADDFSSQENLDVPEAGGWDAMLSSEDEDEYFDLQIVKHYDGEVRIWPTHPQGSQRPPGWI